MSAERRYSIGQKLLLLLLILWLLIPSSKPPENPSKTEKPIEKATFLKTLKQSTQTNQAEASVSSLRVLQNSNTAYHFNPQGAQLSRVVLKKHKNQHENPLSLVDPNSSSMTWILPVKGQEPVHTHKLSFTLIQEQDNSLIFAHNHQKDDEIIIHYSIEGDTLTQKITLGPAWDKASEARFVWYTTPENQEHTIQRSRKETYLMYGENDGTYQTLEQKHIKKEIIEQGKTIKNPTWFAILRPYFLSGIIMGQSRSSLQFSMETIDENQKDTEIIKKIGLRAAFDISDLRKGQQLTFYFGPNDYPTLQKIAQDHDAKYFERTHYFGPYALRTINQYIIAPIFQYLDHTLGHPIWALLLIVLLLITITAPLAYKAHIYQLQTKAAQPFIKANTKEKIEESHYYQKLGLRSSKALLNSILNLILFICMFCFIPYCMAFRHRSFLGMRDCASYDDLITLPFAIPYWGRYISTIGLLIVCVPILLRYLRKPKNHIPEKNTNKLLQALGALIQLGIISNRVIAFALYRLFQSLAQKMCSTVFDRIVDQEQIVADIQTKVASINDEAVPSRAQTRLERRIQKKL